MSDTRFTVVVALLLLLAPPHAEAQKRLQYGNQLYYDDNEQLMRLERDTNQDGVYDHFEHYAGGRKPVRIERDENRDGKLDFWQFFDDTGRLTRQEQDQSSSIPNRSITSSANVNTNAGRSGITSSPLSSSNFSLNRGPAQVRWSP